MNRFGFLILILLSSCTATEHFVPAAVDPKRPNIEIYLAGVHNPKKEYEILSYIETTGTVFANKNQLIRAVRKKTQELGGDAVINVNFFYRPWAFSSLPAVEGVVIKYK